MRFRVMSNNTKVYLQNNEVERTFKSEFQKWAESHFCHEAVIYVSTKEKNEKRESRIYVEQRQASFSKSHVLTF